MGVVGLLNKLARLLIVLVQDTVRPRGFSLVTVAKIAASNPLERGCEAELALAEPLKSPLKLHLHAQLVGLAEKFESVLPDGFENALVVAEHPIV